MRDAEPLGEDDAGLAVALVVGLEAGEHEVELLVRHRRRERVGDDERVGRGERVVLDVQRAIRAARERLADHLLHARRPGRADDHLAAVLLAQAQRLLERVGVGLVHLVADVLFADPVLSSRRRGCHSRVGTCLMQTAIFMLVASFTVTGRGAAEARRSASSDAGLQIEG